MNCSTGTKYGKANSHIFATYYCKYTENKDKTLKRKKLPTSKIIKQQHWYVSAFYIINWSDIKQCNYVHFFNYFINANSYMPCCAHAVPLPFSDSAVSFMIVRVVAGNIRTASPTV
jgi:hypothetical protein